MGSYLCNSSTFSLKNNCANSIRPQYDYRFPKWTARDYRPRQRKKVENEKQNSTMISKKVCYLTLAANIEYLSQRQKNEQRFPPVYLL